MMKPCSNVPFFSLPLIQVIEMLNFLSFVQCVWMGELACMWVWVVVVVLCVFLCVCVCVGEGERESIFQTMNSVWVCVSMCVREKEHFPNYEQYSVCTCVWMGGWVNVYVCM